MPIAKIVALVEIAAVMVSAATGLRICENRRKAERQMHRSRRLSEHTKKRVAEIEADAARQ